MAKAATLGDPAAAVERALTADLPKAARVGITLLETLAARTDDAAVLLSARPCLVETLR